MAMPVILTPGMRGCLSETIAIAWLIERGYSVFPNHAPEGPIDLIALDQRTGETILIDVKTLYQQGKYVTPLSPTETQFELGVRFLVVNGRDCFLLPPGQRKYPPDQIKDIIAA